MKPTLRVQLVSLLTALAGLVALLNQLPVLHDVVKPFEDQLLSLDLRVAGHVTSAILGLVLLYLSVQLWQGKRTAWIASLVLFAATGLVHLLKGPHLGAAAVSIAMVAVLLVARGDFRAPADPPSLVTLLWFVPGYFAAVFIYGFATLIIEHDRVSPDLTVVDSVAAILAGLVGAEGPYTYSGLLFSDVFPLTLLGLGIAGLVFFLVLLFRPIVSRPSPDPDEWQHAERLVRSYGWDTLAYFALRDDKSYFFSSDGEAMVAYAYLGRMALVSGDPIGAPKSIPLVIDEFVRFAHNRGWSVGFLAVREADAELYTSRDLHTFYLGDEAILHCRDFTLEGHKMKGLRQAGNRVAKRYSFRVLDEREAGDELVGELNAITRVWRRDEPERGFTMSLSEDVTGDNEGFLLAVADLAEVGADAEVGGDTDGKGDDHAQTDTDEGANGDTSAADEKPMAVGGFLRFVPAYGDDFGYTLDLMRHDPAAPNGMTEYLISQTALALHERGVDRLSMNFATWSRLWQSDIEFSTPQKLARFFVRRLNRYFQIKSLYDFNEKFDPEWLPRSIVYDGATSLPRTAILFAGVEGFLRFPVVGRYFVPKVVRDDRAQAAPSDSS